MIRLEDPDGTCWGKNFNSHVGRNVGTYRVYWHIARRKLLSEYGGKISFVFEDDKLATFFIMKWS